MERYLAHSRREELTGEDNTYGKVTLTYLVAALGAEVSWTVTKFGAGLQTMRFNSETIRYKKDADITIEHSLQGYAEKNKGMSI